MSISQQEAVSLLNRTIFRPGWRISAAPVEGDDDQVRVGIEIETVDSSFVTRGGEYRVPLTERALVRISSGDYETPQELLFRLLAFTRELQGHEDREFLRTWDSHAERWTAPLHGHTPEGQSAWDRLKELPQPAMTREGRPAADGGPWMIAGCDSDYVSWAEEDSKREVVSAGCDQEDDRGDCWESGHRSRTVHAAGCDDGILDQDCWENGKRALVRAAAAPCNEQVDDDDEGPQRRVLAHAIRGAGCTEADDAALTECTEQR